MTKRSSGQDEQVLLIGCDNGFIRRNISRQNFRQSRRARMVEHRGKAASPQIRVDNEHTLLRKLRIAQAQIHGCQGLALAGSELVIAMDLRPVFAWVRMSLVRNPR